MFHKVPMTCICILFTMACILFRYGLIAWPTLPAEEMDPSYSILEFCLAIVGSGYAVGGLGWEDVYIWPCCHQWANPMTLWKEHIPNHDQLPKENMLYGCLLYMGKTSPCNHHHCPGGYVRGVLLGSKEPAQQMNADLVWQHIPVCTFGKISARVRGCNIKLWIYEWCGIHIHGMSDQQLGQLWFIFVTCICMQLKAIKSLLHIPWVVLDSYCPETQLCLN